MRRLLKALGAKLAPIEAPFEPEGGAYESAHGACSTRTVMITAHGHGHHTHDH